MHYPASLPSIGLNLFHTNQSGLLFLLSFLVGCSNQVLLDSEVDPDAGGKWAKHEVDKLVLVDAVTGNDISELTDNYEFTASSVSIRAESDAPSMVFKLSGAESHRQVENEVPFALKGSNLGKYIPWIPTPGDYTVTATPHAGPDGTGRSGSSTTINFRVSGLSSDDGPDPDNPPDPVITQPSYYFNQSFDNVSLTGNTEVKKFNGWNLSGVTTFLTDASLWAHKPPYTQIRMDNTFDNGRKSLYFEVTDKDPSDSWTTRTQMTMAFKDLDIGVYHTSHRMYLSPDLQSLTNYSGSLNWIDIFEIWNKRNPNWSGDPAGSSRISLYLNKSSSTGQPLFWEIKAQYAQPQNILWKPIWPEQTNKAVPVPIGKWFTLDVYVKRGEGTDGHLKVTLIPDNEQPKVLFDIKNHTIYPGHPDLTLKSWQPFKLYVSDQLLDWLRSNNKTAYAYYNDFKWYKE